MPTLIDATRALVCIFAFGVLMRLYYVDFLRPRLRIWRVRKYGIHLQDPLSRAFAFRRAPASPKAAFVYFISHEPRIPVELCIDCAKAQLRYADEPPAIYAVPQSLLRFRACEFCR